MAVVTVTHASVVAVPDNPLFPVGSNEWNAQHNVAGLENVQNVDTTNPANINFTQSATGAVTRTVASKLGEFVSVKDFGAKGDGLTNDAAAIQAALNSGAAVVYFPGTAAGTKYLTLVPLIVPAYTSIRGDGPQASVIWGNFAGNTLVYQDVNTFGAFLRDIGIKGNSTSGTSYGNGTSTGILFHAATQINAHFYMSNVQITGHAMGTNATEAYGMFDSYLESVDFVQCATWGFHWTGSQNTLNGCSFRLCNVGINIASPSAGSVGGGAMLGPTFIGNNVDFDINTSTVRALGIYGGWSEQSVTTSFRNSTGGSVYFQSLVVDRMLFQPSATATGTGTFDVTSLTGIVVFRGCISYQSAYSSATIPLLSGASLMYERASCATYSSGGALTPLADPLGVTFGFSGATTATQAQATTQLLGVNGGQAAAINTEYYVPYNGTLVNVNIATGQTPATGQNFTFTVFKNGSSVGSPGVINNGSFGVNIPLNISVLAGDVVYIQSTFSATSGSSNVRYYANFMQ